MTVFKPLTNPYVRLYFAIVAPFLLASVIGGIISGCLYVAENRYFEQGLDYVGAQYVRSQLNRDLFFALLSASVFFVIVALLYRRFRSLWVWLWMVYAVQLMLLTSRVLQSQGWAVDMIAIGKWGEWTTESYVLKVPIPLVFKEFGFLIWNNLVASAVIAGLLVAASIVAVVIYGRRKRKREHVRAPAMLPQALARSSAWAFVIALVIGLGVNVAAGLVPSAQATAPYNVVWIIWDSTRADHLSSYGYPRPTSPNVDGFAQDAVLFETAFSQYNWTRPSVASMMVGQHKWQFSGAGMTLLPSVALAEVLKNHGYRTFGYIQNPQIDARLGFNQGFDTYLQLLGRSTPDLMSHFVLERIQGLTRENQPFFLFVHLQEPHWPYRIDSPFYEQFVEAAEPPPLSQRRVKKLMQTNGRDMSLLPILRTGEEQAIRYMLESYDADIRSTDEALGEIFDALRKNNLWDDTLVIFNSDHGDEFNEHGQYGHAHDNLHPELTHVPMIMGFPADLGIPPQRVAAPVQNLDIYPTILGALGIPIPRHLFGENLLPLEALAALERVILSDREPLVMLRTREHGLLVDYAQGNLSFFDLTTDPAELMPLADYREDQAFLQLRGIFDQWHEQYLARAAAQEDGDGEQMSEELLESLKSLGYVE